LLKRDGYLAIISFHSLEDGLVKWDFKDKQREGTYRVLTKKPIVAERSEVAANRRARSAKLRIAQKN
jgi:16S rRNA (cytosine1402-N4)-methyltransferase